MVKKWLVCEVHPCREEAVIYGKEMAGLWGASM